MITDGSAILNVNRTDNLPLSLSQTGNNNIQVGNVGTLIINNSISKSHFNDILDEDFKNFFVETSIYKQVSTCLNEKNVVILIGQPGVGKTITSKKVANDYRLRGFKILYSEEGNIANAKDVLSEINPEDKTLIILNDFLGQFYTGLKMDKESEIKGLVENIKRHKNIKLLINTRGIIYQEAMQDEKFNSAIEDNSNLIHEIEIGELSFDEKALILLNHLKRSYNMGFLPKEHYLDIVKDRKYAEIIIHKNFNPRIIEHMTRKKLLAKIESTEYGDQIFKALENPEKIWKKEYEELDELDRICLNTLFSLTNTNVPIRVLKECFYARLKKLDKDSTINHFEKSISRLTDSLVSVIICNKEQRIGIINPSLNDFIFGYLTGNQNEMDKIIENSLYYEQIDKIISCKTQKNKLIEQINAGIFDRLSTFPKQIFSEFESYFESPRYLHILKILLIYLEKSEVALCGIDKEDIQNFLKGIFQNQYNRIEADARLYFAYELPDIFAKLLTNSNGYDLTEIIATEKYFSVILNSIVKHDDFWNLLVDIQKKYFVSINEEFYMLKDIKSCIIEKITSEAIRDLYDDILVRISFEIEKNYDELENYDDYQDITDYILNSIEDEIRELILESISSKLDEHNINSICEDDFDIYLIISEEVDLDYMIECEYDKAIYIQSDDFKESVEKSIKNIIVLFEDVSWTTID